MQLSFELINKSQSSRLNILRNTQRLYLRLYLAFSIVALFQKNVQSLSLVNFLPLLVHKKQSNPIALLLSLSVTLTPSTLISTSPKTHI